MKEYANLFRLVNDDGDFFLDGKLGKKWMKIKANKIVSSLENAKELNYYVYAYHDSPRFVFITKVRMNPNILETYGMYGGAYEINGALFDNRTQKFISYRGGISLTYVLNDAGIPHIIKDTASDKYVVMYFAVSGDTFPAFKTDFDNITGLVTHVRVNRGSAIVERYRYIFCEKDGESAIIVISNELELTVEIQGTTLVECINGICCEEPDRWYLYYHRLITELKKSLSEAVFGEDSSMVKEISIPTYILIGDAAIIVSDKKGIYGDKVMIVPGDDPLTYGYNSFYNYEVIHSLGKDDRKHNVVKVEWRRSDFDNSTSYFDILTRTDFADM